MTGGKAPDWRKRLFVLAVASFFTLVLLVLALVFAAQALFAAYLAWIGDPALAATATAVTLLLAVAAVWLVARATLRPRRRSTPGDAGDDLLQEGARLAGRHPFVATGAAFAAGLAVSRSDAADSLIAAVVTRPQRRAAD